MAFEPIMSPEAVLVRLKELEDKDAWIRRQITAVSEAYGGAILKMPTSALDELAHLGAISQAITEEQARLAMFLNKLYAYHPN